jgi:hypothetical protein
MILDGAPADPAWLGALAPILRDESLDPAFRALMLRLPEDETLAAHLADRGETPDPDAIHAARAKPCVAPWRSASPPTCAGWSTGWRRWCPTAPTRPRPGGARCG